MQRAPTGKLDGCGGLSRRMARPLGASPAYARTSGAGASGWRAVRWRWDAGSRPTCAARVAAYCRPRLRQHLVYWCVYRLGASSGALRQRETPRGVLPPRRVAPRLEMGSGRVGLGLYRLAYRVRSSDPGTLRLSRSASREPSSAGSPKLFVSGRLACCAPRTSGSVSTRSSSWCDELAEVAFACFLHVGRRWTAPLLCAAPRIRYDTEYAKGTDGEARRLRRP